MLNVEGFVPKRTKDGDVGAVDTLRVGERQDTGEQRLECPCGRLVPAQRGLEKNPRVTADGRNPVDQALALDLLFLGQPLRVLDFIGDGVQGGEGHAIGPADAAVPLAALAVAAPAGRVGPVKEAGPSEILLDVGDGARAEVQLLGKFPFAYPDVGRAAARLEVLPEKFLERQAEIFDMDGLQAEALPDALDLEAREKRPMVESALAARPGLGGIACAVELGFVESAAGGTGAAWGVAASGAACTVLF